MLKKPQPGQPYKQNDLFTGGPRIDLNACVGTNGGPYELDDYALGYFEAATRLSDSLISNPLYVDVVIYPLVFIYRHGIELYLKHLSSLLPRIWGVEATVKATHTLLDNWETVRKFVARHPDFDSGDELVTAVDKILKDMVEIDPTGEAFRFPHARSGSRFLQNTSWINVEVLARSLDSVYKIFEYWCDLAEEVWNQKCESEGSI